MRMLSDCLAKARAQPPLTAAAVVTIVGVLTICSLYFLQYVMSVAPCHLCLEQRNAFYFSVPLAALLWLGANHGASSKVMIAGLAMIAIVMLWNSGLAAYHAGVEWKFWAGPTDCTGPIDKFGSVRDMMSQLRRMNIVRCDEVSWSFLGISLAGWDVPLSLMLSAVAAWGAKAALAQSRRTG